MTKSPIFITIIMIRKFYIAVICLCAYSDLTVCLFFLYFHIFLAKYYDIFFWVQIPYICIWNCKNFHKNKIHILFNLVIKQEKSICDQIWFNWKSGSFSYMRHIVCRTIIQAERVTWNRNLSGSNFVSCFMQNQLIYIDVFVSLRKCTELTICLKNKELSVTSIIISL